MSRLVPARLREEFPELERIADKVVLAGGLDLSATRVTKILRAHAAHLLALDPAGDAVAPAAGDA